MHKDSPLRPMLPAGLVAAIKKKRSLRRIRASSIKREELKVEPPHRIGWMGVVQELQRSPLLKRRHDSIELAMANAMNAMRTPDMMDDVIRTPDLSNVMRTPDLSPDQSPTLSPIGTPLRLEDTPPPLIKLEPSLDEEWKNQQDDCQQDDCQQDDYQQDDGQQDAVPF